MRFYIFNYSFIRASINPYIRSFIYSFNHLVFILLPFIFTPSHLTIHSLIHSVIHSLINSLIHSFIHSFIYDKKSSEKSSDPLHHSFIQSFNLSLIHSFIHLLILSLILFSHKTFHSNSGVAEWMIQLEQHPLLKLQFTLWKGTLWALTD